MKKLNYLFLAFCLFVILFIFKNANTNESWENKEEKKEENLFKVYSVESIAKEIDETVILSSTTEAFRKISIKSELTSKVEKVLLNKGTIVKKNDLVLKLEDYDSFKKLYSKELISKNEFNKIALLAPFAGIILDGHKIEGELLTPGDTAYELIDLSKIKAKSYINENQIIGISKNNKVQIKILDNTINAQIDYISPMADKNTKTFEIVVVIKNPNLIYKDGMSSEITIFNDKVKAHKISPSVLSLNDYGDIGIKVLDEESKVLFKKIIIIEDTSDYMLVSGLSDKETIITVGHQYVSTGDKVSTQ